MLQSNYFFSNKATNLRIAPDKIVPILSSGKAGMLIQWMPGISSEYPLDLDCWKIIFKLSLHFDNICASSLWSLLGEIIGSL